MTRRNERIERGDEGGEDRRPHRDEKEAASAHDGKVGHLLLHRDARAVYAPEDADPAHGDNGGGNARGENGAGGLLPQIHEHGRDEKDVHADVERAVKRPRGARGGDIENHRLPPPAQQDETDEQGHENEVEDGDALHAAVDEETPRAQPQYGKQRLCRGE